MSKTAAQGGPPEAPTSTREATPAPEPDIGAPIEALLDAIHDHASPDLWSRVEALVAALLAWHGAGLRHILALASKDDGPPATLVDRIARDPRAAAFLLLHDLHPVETRRRVESALEEVRPTLAAHRGDVELVGIDDGVARVRLLGRCRGCASSSTTLERLVVQAVEQAAPELTGVTLVDAPKSDAAPLVTLDPTRRGPRSEPAVGTDSRCELCAEPLPSDHPHVIDLRTRRLRCACRACALLFRDASTATGRHRTVPDRILHDAMHPIPPEVLAALGIPVRLAFVSWDGVRQRAIAGYPSPAGTVEAELAPDQWASLRTASPLARIVEPDVEAILIHGDPGQPCECLLVPIDACYRLVAVVRRHWEGMQGGDRVWREVAAALAELHDGSRPLDALQGDVP